MTTTKMQRIRENMIADQTIARAALGDSVICKRCGATIKTYDDACLAGAEWCDGATTYEEALRVAAHAREIISK